MIAKNLSAVDTTSNNVPIPLKNLQTSEITSVLDINLSNDDQTFRQYFRGGGGIDFRRSRVDLRGNEGVVWRADVTVARLQCHETQPRLLLLITRNWVVILLPANRIFLESDLLKVR